MASKHEKKRRRAIVRSQREHETAREISEMPLSLHELGSLFSQLDAALASAPCDHSMRHTEAILRSLGLAPEVIVPWLGRFGGYCDCEVLANVEDTWEPRIASS
jgi:hypothetical protein